MSTRAAILLSLVSALVFFQNCSRGYQSSSSTLEGSSVSGDPNGPSPFPMPGPGPTPGPSPMPGPAPAPAPVLKNEWLSMNPNGAPSARFGHSAVWTGTEMIIFGGADRVVANNTASQILTTITGSIFNPQTNTWRPMSPYPFVQASGAFRNYDSRTDHFAVWTGKVMLVYGGYHWGPSSVNPIIAALYPASVATNSNLTVLGGRYDPVTDTWTALNGVNAARIDDSGCAVWTGSKMIVYGLPFGLGNNAGAIYDPELDTWMTIPAPTGNRFSSCVWSGKVMITFGGQVYNSATQTSAVTNTGVRLDPNTNTRTAISSVNAPSARYGHSSVWTGNKMFIWGGRTGSALFNNGALYDPVTDTWKAVSMVGAPSVRYGARAVWTGSKVIVFGGFANLQDGDNGRNALLAPGGGIYDPSTDVWEPLPTVMAPSNRGNHAVVWTGSQMIIWGGSPHALNNLEFSNGTVGSFLGTGGIYH